MFLLAFASAHAADSVFAVNPLGSWLTGGGITIGTPFQVGPETVNIRSLGYYDQGGDGLASAHTVGIYSLGQDLLGSVIIPSGTTATRWHDGTRWMNLDAPIDLAANTGYMLAFTTPSSGDRVNMDSAIQVTIDPHFALVGTEYFFANGPGLAYPTKASGYGKFAFGGNMSTIPEPQTWALCGVVLCVVAGYVIRHRRTVTA